MPQSYIYRMVAMEFRRVPKEKPFPIEPEVKNRLSSSQLQRLTRAKSSIYKFTQFADTLSQEELDERVAEEEKRQEVWTSRGFSCPRLNYIIFFLMVVMLSLLLNPSARWSYGGLTKLHS